MRFRVWAEGGGAAFKGLVKLRLGALMPEVRGMAGLRGMGRNEALQIRHRVRRTRNAQPEAGNPEIFRLTAPELCVSILGGEP